MEERACAAVPRSAVEVGGVGGDSGGGNEDEAHEDGEVFGEGLWSGCSDKDDGEEGPEDNGEKEEVKAEDFEERGPGEDLILGRDGAFEDGFPVFGGVEVREAGALEGVGLPVGLVHGVGFILTFFGWEF